jgi:hypothetical protein
MLRSIRPTRASSPTCQSAPAWLFVAGFQLFEVVSRDPDLLCWPGRGYGTIGWTAPSCTIANPQRSVLELRRMVAGVTWRHFATRRPAAGWTINVQRERPDDPRIAPTRPRMCRRPAPPPATATGRAPAGRPGGGGSGGRPTRSPGPADLRPESPVVQDRRGGGPVLRHERGSFPVPPTRESPGREPGHGSIRDPHTSVCPRQVAIGPDEARPSGKSHSPVLGVPGFPGSIPGPLGVHDHRSLSMAGGVGGTSLRASIAASYLNKL